MKCQKCGYPDKPKNLNCRVKRMLKYMNKQSGPIFGALSDMDISEIENTDDELAMALKNNFVEKTKNGFLCTKKGIKFANT